MSDTFAETAGLPADSFETNVGTNAGGTSSPGMETEAGEGLVVNLSGTSEKGNFKTLTVGFYDATVAQLDFGKSQNAGNDMWTWVFEIEGGEFSGSKLFYHTTFNEGGLPRVKRTLARIKTEDDYSKWLLDNNFSPAKVSEEGRLLGARCRLKVGVRPYQGEIRNEIKDVLPPQAGGAAGGGSAFSGV